MKFNSRFIFTASLVLAMAFTFSCSSGDDDEESYYSGGRGNDIANYRTVEIGEQTWMAENLDYGVKGAQCYGYEPESFANCAIYGPLYNWAAAMALPASCNETLCASQINAKHRGICPEGWHIPSSAEWDQLSRYVDGTSDNSSLYESRTAGMYLKATSGWSGKNGQDTYGFAALPGGSRGHSGFNFIGEVGNWWSASESNSGSAYELHMGNGTMVGWFSNGKKNLSSLRCVQD